MTGGGIIQEKEEEQHSPLNPATHYSRNKIYNANTKSPKSRNHQRTKNMPTNAD